MLRSSNNKKKIFFSVIHKAFLLCNFYIISFFCNIREIFRNYKLSFTIFTFLSKKWQKRGTKISFENVVTLSVTVIII